jgi:fumarylacetoacetate (FAA) hydrolase family protein
MDYKQVIGCAYTYRVSLVVRDKLAVDRVEHSSHSENAFSYFRKVDSVDDVVEDGGNLVLRKHPLMGEEVDHWCEPELGIVLGEKHEIVGYVLGNDFTAASVEFEAESDDYDPTYYAKCWKGSCSLSPKFDFEEDEYIGLKIERGGEVIYDFCYNTRNRLREFSELPGMVVEKYKSYSKLKESKKILVDKGFLVPGTVILVGSGLILPRRFYSHKGDEVIVYCGELDLLRNKIV